MSDDIVVKYRDGKVYADSRDVARIFEKDHFHVLEKYRKMPISDEFKGSHFRVCEQIQAHSN